MEWMHGWELVYIVGLLVVVLLAILGVVVSRVQRYRIVTEADYQAALQEIEQLAAQTIKPGSAEAQRLEMLSIAVWGYEAHNNLPTT